MAIGNDIESSVPARKGDGRGGRQPAQTYAPVDGKIYAEVQRKAWLVPTIVVANFAFFILAMYVNNCPRNHHTRSQGKCVARFLGRFSFEPLSVNPLVGPSFGTLKTLGAVDWSKIVLEHQAWRLVTCIWLHAGIIDLLANMTFLVYIGIGLEQQFGSIRIGMIYLLSGFGGSILSSLFIQNDTIPIGAAGALFGLVGSMLARTIYTNKVAAFLRLLVIIVITLAIGTLPYVVGNFAYIGGLLAGFFLGFVLLRRPQSGWLDNRRASAGTRLKSQYKTYQYVLWLVSLILLVTGLAVGLVLLFRGKKGDEYCRWCHYLECIPTSWWTCD